MPNAVSPTMSRAIGQRLPHMRRQKAAEGMAGAFVGEDKGAAFRGHAATLRLC